MVVEAEQLEQMALHGPVQAGNAVQQNQQQELGFVGNVGVGHQQELQQQGQQQQEEEVVDEVGQEEEVRPGSHMRIVAVHEGKGRVAQRDFQEPEWLDGLLCVYEDGHLAFLWKGVGVGAGVGSSLVEYLRVEEEVVTGSGQQRRGGGGRVSRTGSGMAGRSGTG
jgi:hypothetical protein